ncbi:MAG: type II toxin-antitoxin system HicA family toxin [Prevotellaceae bacterium]|jgi:hypothetical protein|nr:type II toxin-antitoxin system HicA family toxin [Prevotellaceae bacterium]
MSKIDKLILKLISKPKDFTYNELRTLLLTFGYSEVQGAGSRVCFEKNDHKIKLHKPHPSNIMKLYQLDLVINELKDKGLIK